MEPVFLNKAARRRKVVELSQALKEAGIAAKREYKARMKHAWFKPENTPSCKVRASILGYDKKKKREQLERHLREEARKSRRRG